VSLLDVALSIIPPQLVMVVPPGERQKNSAGQIYTGDGIPYEACLKVNSVTRKMFIDHGLTMHKNYKHVYSTPSLTAMQRYSLGLSRFNFSGKTYQVSTRTGWQDTDGFDSYICIEIPFQEIIPANGLQVNQDDGGVTGFNLVPMNTVIESDISFSVAEIDTLSGMRSEEISIPAEESGFNFTIEPGSLDIISNGAVGAAFSLDSTSTLAYTLVARGVAMTTFQLVTPGDFVEYDDLRPIEEIDSDIYGLSLAEVDSVTAKITLYSRDLGEMISDQFTTPAPLSQLTGYACIVNVTGDSIAGQVTVTQPLYKVFEEFALLEQP